MLARIQTYNTQTALKPVWTPSNTCDTDPHPLCPSIEEMLYIVLKKNVFEFNGDYFLQLQGTAMGTKVAPAYANLLMGSLEPNLGHPYIMLWKRYIDDIFLIWTDSTAQLKTFISYKHQQSPSHNQIHTRTRSK